MFYKNKIELRGIVGKDPELKKGKSGVPFIRTSLGYKKYSKDGTEASQASWFTVIAFRQDAERIAQAGKGAHLNVEGELQMNIWTDKQGKKHYDVEILANDVEVIRRDKKEKTFSTPPEDLEPGVPTENQDLEPEAESPSGADPDDVPF